jgi:polysaccharide export outer membrane protein
MLVKHVLRGTCLIFVMSGALMAQNPPPAPPPTSPPAVTPVVTPTQTTAAQQAAQAATGKSVTNDQISDAIKNSGLSQQQIRDRLKAAGYDAGLADPFFTRVGQAAVPPSSEQPAGSASAASGGTPQTAFVRALTELGILSPEPPAKPTPEEKLVREPEDDRLNRARAVARGSGLFGKDVFSGVSSAFDPVTSGPVDPSYRLGVGDQLQLVVTGQVELGYALELRRDGTVIVPQVGQISLAGLTLEGARALLKTRMAHSYSGLNSGEAILDLTVSRIRANSVFVIGEVENPGSYQVSALSTVFYALARAGGPTVRGSFREVQVRRAGQLLRTIDLYDYLLRGDASNDIRTEQGDIIFVPLDTKAIAVTGAVRRPGVFELRTGESFTDLLQFAGGVLASASLDRIQIDRVLPPEQRKPGFERVKMDILLHGRIDTLRTVALHDSDIITVFSIGDVRRNIVTIVGAVFQPGEYEITGGMTLDSLLKKAQGTLPSALVDRVKIRRQVAATGRSESFSLDLADSTARHFPLAEFDEVAVLDGRVAFPPGSITISGAVRRPFDGSYSEHARLRDVVDLAGGFEDYALADRIMVERPIFETGRAKLFSVDFRTDSGKSFAMERGDRITVLDARTAFPGRLISVLGAVVNPGERPYVLNESLKDAIQRAGGFREEAQLIEVYRKKTGADYSDTTSLRYSFPVTSNFDRDSTVARFLLQGDDHVSVLSSPGFRSQKFVSVEGQFRFPGTFAITENHDRVSDIVARAGGVLPGAYPESFRLLRDGKPVAVDFAGAVRGNRAQNMSLLGGDVLTIDRDPKTVFVTGAVSRPSLILYKPGLSVEDYIELAGGPTEKGQASKAVVDYPSGYSKRVKRVALFFHESPDVVSGATISVPQKPESTTTSSEIWARVFAAATALASLIVAVVAVKHL